MQVRILPEEFIEAPAHAGVSSFRVGTPTGPRDTNRARAGGTDGVAARGPEGHDNPGRELGRWGFESYQQLKHIGENPTLERATHAHLAVLSGVI